MWHMSDHLDWLLWRGISFKALMALGSNYLQELIEAYVSACSLCSAEDHPLPAFPDSPAGSQCGLLPHFCVFREHSKPAGKSEKCPIHVLDCFIYFIVTPAIFKAILATGLGSLAPMRNLPGTLLLTKPAPTEQICTLPSLGTPWKCCFSWGEGNQLELCAASKNLLLSETCTEKHLGFKEALNRNQLNGLERRTNTELL